MATEDAVVVDVRPLPPAQKHPAIFRTFDSLAPGETMLLVNDHDPKPLYYQFTAERAGQFQWQYLESGPEVWKVAIRRVGSPQPAQAPAEALGCCGHAAPVDHGHSHHHGHGGPPTQVLKEEHALILQALEALEKKLTLLERGAAPDAAYFLKAVEFLRTFADGCHHGKEENLLFKTMVNRGFPLHGGPIAVMLSEHDAGRAFIRGIAEGTAKVGSDPTAVRQIVENGRGYIGLLRAHIDKENNILFPMADNVLSPEDQADLEQAFERFETEETGAGVHKASLKLLEELQAGAR
jgi:hemerythrin-like domain-containing protein